MTTPSRRFARLPVALLATLSLCACTSSPGLAPAPWGSRLIVTTRGDSRLEVIDPASGATLERLETGQLPAALAVSPDGGLAVVANGGNEEHPGTTLSVFDLALGSLVHTVELEPYTRPGRMAFTGRDGALLVVAEHEDALIEVDPLEGSVMRVLPCGGQGPNDLAITPDGGLAFVANVASQTLGVIGLDTGTVLASLPLGDAPTGVAIAPDGGEVWVALPGRPQIARFSVRSLERLPAVPCAEQPYRLRFVHSGRWVLVTYPTRGQVGVIGAYTHHENWRFPSTSEAGRRTLESDEVQSGWPTEIALDDQGRHAFVINFRAALVTVLDLEELVVKGRIPTGPQPTGVAWSSSGGGRSKTPKPMPGE
jgi:YVTN family beta-propeller protein